MQQCQSVKFTYHHELHALTGDGIRSTVVYQHAHWSAPVPVQAQQRLAEAAAASGLDPVATVIASRGTNRLFIILSTSDHRHRLEERLRSIEAGPWGAVLKVAWPDDTTAS